MAYGFNDDKSKLNISGMIKAKEWTASNSQTVPSGKSVLLTADFSDQANAGYEPISVFVMVTDSDSKTYLLPTWIRYGTAQNPDARHLVTKFYNDTESDITLDSVTWLTYFAKSAVMEWDEA